MPGCCWLPSERDLLHIELCVLLACCTDCRTKSNKGAVLCCLCSLVLEHSVLSRRAVCALLGL
jgi:hypothetical protein